MRVSQTIDGEEGELDAEIVVGAITTERGQSTRP